MSHRTLQVSHSSAQNSPDLTQYFPELSRSHTVLSRTLQVSHSSTQNSSDLTQFFSELSRSHTVPSRPHTALPRTLQTSHSFFQNSSGLTQFFPELLRSHSSAQNSPGLTQFFPELFRSHTVLSTTLQISHSFFQNCLGLTDLLRILRSRNVYTSSAMLTNSLWEWIALSVTAHLWQGQFGKSTPWHAK
jgi:hypothetical protein